VVGYRCRYPPPMIISTRRAHEFVTQFAILNLLRRLVAVEQPAHIAMPNNLRTAKLFFKISGDRVVVHDPHRWLSATRHRGVKLVRVQSTSWRVDDLFLHYNALPIGQASHIRL
jgi:hypothetical protein